MSKARQRTLAWSLAAGWLLLIYATVPLVEKIVQWSYYRFDVGWYPVGVATLLALAGFGMARPLFGLAGGRAAASWPRRAGFLLLALTTLLVFRSIAEPVAKIHLVQYGLLAFLVWRAVRLDVPDRSAYASAGLISLAGGLGDEFVQGLAPNRVGELSDAGLNLCAAALALGFIALLAERRDAPGMRAHSLRWLSASAAAVLAVFFVFISWNPDLYYGHRHRVDGRLTFYSRLTLAELEAEDAARDAARIAALEEQYGAETRLRLANLERGLEAGVLESPLEEREYALLRHVLLHHDALRRLMLEGRPDEAFREYVVHKLIYGSALWAYAPFWSDEVERRVRELIPEAAQEPPFISAFLPDAPTPAHPITTAGGRYVAFAPLPAEVARDILRRRLGDYTRLIQLLPSEAAYNDFLARHPAARDPFLREMRVHLFRRDRYALLGSYEVAWWEDHILEGYFGQTLAATRWAWSEATRRRVAALVPEPAASRYESPVGDNYLYWASRGGLQAACLLAGGLLLILHRLTARRLPT